MWIGRSAHDDALKSQRPRPGEPGRGITKKNTMEHLALTGGSPTNRKPFPAWPVFGAEEKEGLIRVLESGKWGSTNGGEVRTFERRFADFHNAKYGIATTSGTTALAIAMRAAGIGPGDEVLLPSYTFVASATAILDALGKPVFVDIEPETFNIDPRSVLPALTPRSKAILPVHFGGRPAEMDSLRHLAREHNLRIIEDACQAWGSVYKGGHVGTLGDAGCFSFQSSKNITAGEGGMILTNNPDIAAASRSIANCGRTEEGPWYDHHSYGGNYRLTEFQGALLNAQLDRYPSLQRQREEAARFLRDGIEGIEGFENLTPMDVESRSSWHLFVFRIDTACWGEIGKEKIVEAIQAEGIPVSPGYALPVYKQPLFTERNFGAKGGPTAFFEQGLPDFRHFRLRNVESACSEQALWLTQNTLLADEGMLRSVIQALAKVFGGKEQLKRGPVESG